MALAPQLDSLKQLFNHPHLHFITDDAQLQSMSTDWRNRYHGKPYIAVEPSRVEALQDLMKHCYAHGIAIIPQGGNTGLCGGATPDTSKTQVLVSLKRLDSIHEVDIINASLTVGAGCTLQRVQEEAEKAGYFFPVSLAAQGTSQIGGNLSTNAGGVHVIRYGMIREWVLGLEVVLPDGQLWSGLRKLRKDNTGYALKQLFIGAEGTLGIITAATLKMIPQWSHSLGVWMSVETLSEVTELLALFKKMAGDRLSAFEVMSKQNLLWVQEAHPHWTLPATLNEWTLWIELGETAPHSDLLSWFEAHLYKIKRWENNMVIMQSLSEQKKGWQWRETIPSAKHRAVKALNYDISLPISECETVIQALESSFKEVFPVLKHTTFGHWGDGNLHFSAYVADKETPADYLSANENDISLLVYDLVHAYSGSISAEHGLGQLKVTQIQRYHSGVEQHLMRRVKEALDPLYLMNPNKILNTPSMY